MVISYRLVPEVTWSGNAAEERVGTVILEIALTDLHLETLSWSLLGAGTGCLLISGPGRLNSYDRLRLRSLRGSAMWSFWESLVQGGPNNKLNASI
jgi:hypothetical protein